jgi:hypothetical protein
MADDPEKRGPADRSRVNVNEDDELRNWSDKWNVSHQQLRDPVKQVRPSAEKVARHLGKSLGAHS